MSTRLAEIVHIIPLGHEIDRAVRPFDSGLANRVYLLVDTGAGTSKGNSERDKRMQQEQQTIYTPAVKNNLEKKGIKVQVVPTKTFDLGTLLLTITSIIRMEKELGSSIQINVSSSGRLGAIASFLAGMAYDVPTYYVHSDHFSTDAERKEHGVSFCAENHVTYLPEFHYSIPDKTSGLVLKLLMNTDDGDVFTPKMIIQYLEENKAEGFVTKEEELKKIETKNLSERVVESRKLMRLATVMKKLEESGYVSVERTGRYTSFSITELGKHAYYLSGVMKEDYKTKFMQTGEEQHD